MERPRTSYALPFKSLTGAYFHRQEQGSTQGGERSFDIFSDVPSETTVIPNLIGSGSAPTVQHIVPHSSQHGRSDSHRSRKSFSSLSLTKDEPRSPGQRGSSGLSGGLRALFGSHKSRESSDIVEEATDEASRAPRSNWLRRATSTTLKRTRRPSEISDSRTALREDLEACPGDHVQQSSRHRMRGLSPVGGAAARAAAAAASRASADGCAELLQGLVIDDHPKLADPKIPNDGESGIGIEIRNSECLAESDSLVSRMDPTLRLPEELFAQILSYLDAVSLTRAELVSRRWCCSASSNHVWRAIFKTDCMSSSPSPTRSARNLFMGGLGFGGGNPTQDWKRMWQVRKKLNKRWKDGRAAAVYLKGHKDSVYCVQFDEHKIVTGSRDRTVRIWDAHTYACTKVLGVPKATTQNHQPLQSRQIVGQQPIAHVEPSQYIQDPIRLADGHIQHEGSVLCLQFDQSIMVTGSSDCSLIVWDINKDYAPLTRLRNHSAGVLDVCFDERHIVSCSKDTTISIWDRKSLELCKTLTGHRGPVNAVQLRGDLVVSASGDGIAKLWNLTSGLCIKEFPSRDRGLACVEFSPDSRTILAGGNDKVIYQFDANSGELVRELRGHGDLVRSLHFDSLNGRVISGSYDHSVKAYDIATGEMVCDFVHWTTSWMLSAKADYRRIVATSQDAKAVIMDFGFALPGVELLKSG